MRILHAASEAVPFCKTGGLADVVGALTRKLGAAGHDVALFLPYYRGMDLPELGGVSQPLEIPLGGETLRPSLKHFQSKKVSVFLIDYPPFYDRDGIYGTAGRDHPDNDRRFILFSRAVLAGAKRLGFKPDVVHLHDWQTALVAGYLKREYREDPFFSRTGSVLTIHNIAYQGAFPRETVSLAGFPEDDFVPARLEHDGNFGFLKAGIVFADRITTVSPTYAREIQGSPDFGKGLEGAVSRRSSDLEGVLNGLDLDVWDPQADAALARVYGKEGVVEGKAACKAALQRECSLEVKADVPLIGIVSRFDHMKGLDLAVEALKPLIGRCQVAVLGSGDPALARAFAELAKENPKSVHVHNGFDEPFAHRVYAGSDIFLMPSRFEPCGLGQMIAMRYGALPVVSRTGGLADTVSEESREGSPATGFVCEPGDRESLSQALERALEAYGRGNDEWGGRVSSAMGLDFSWDASVLRYARIYESLSKRA